MKPSVQPEQLAAATLVPYAKSRCEAIASLASESLNCVSIISVFAVHFMFAIGFLLSASGQKVDPLKPYFALYNCIFFVTILWSVTDTLKPGPMQLGTVVNFTSIFFDIIVAIKVSRIIRWILILNIILRPFTSLILLRKSYL